MKFKKIIALLILGIFAITNISPAFAITDNKKEKKKKEQQETIIGYINMPWWRDFGDEYLEGYIEKAILNNYDLKIATLKVEEARQNVKAQMSQELPSLTIGVSPAVAKLPTMTSTSGSFTVPIIANYEIDIFLKNHDKTKSVKKLYEVSKLSEKATYIAIVSAVGATYYNLVKADELINTQSQIVSDRKKIYELMKQRNEQGITSVSDLVKAEKAYNIANANLSDLEKTRVHLLTSLAVLTGDSPENTGEFKRITYDQIKKQKNVPEKLISDVIVNRPDYQASEKMLEKAGIDVKVAKKEFLPSFNIGGLLGLMTMKGVTFNWTNALAGAGIIGLMPILTGGRRIASLKIYKNKYEQAIQEYQKTNITAIKEVNDSLSNLQYDTQKYEKNLQALNAEEKDFQLSEAKYKQGTISYLDLIQKREVLLTTQQMVTSSKMDNFVNQISLYKAVAGNL